MSALWMLVVLGVIPFIAIGIVVVGVLIILHELSKSL